MSENSLPLPSMPRRALWIGLAYGLLIYIWLSLEDNGVIAPALIGTGAACLIGGRWLLLRWGGRAVSRRLWLIGGILWGAIIGAGAAIHAALLMLLKDGLHGHAYPDYPFGVIDGMIARAPAWALAGALIGLGAALLIVQRSRLPRVSTGEPTTIPEL